MIIEAGLVLVSFDSIGTDMHFMQSLFKSID